MVGTGAHGWVGTAAGTSMSSSPHRLIAIGTVEAASEREHGFGWWGLMGDGRERTRVFVQLGSRVR